jgi:hypothetical protein
MELEQLVLTELEEPSDPRVSDMAEALAALYPGSALAVLFYGSCLREKQLEGLMLDFYLIVSSYDRAYDRRWLRTANRLIPPNVFPFVHNGLTAKYAVLSEEDFARECSTRARSASVYARFAQPARLVWTESPAVAASVAGSVADAVRTLLTFARDALPQAERQDPLCVWRSAFRFTYAAELRAERSSRPDLIVESDPERYRRLFDAAGIPEAGKDQRQGQARWRRIQRKGKALTVLRLAKASFTFAGGIDYLAWKINRHAGTKIEIRPWQRRWPLVAAFTLLPRLLARGAVR